MLLPEDRRPTAFTNCTFDKAMTLLSQRFQEYALEFGRLSATSEVPTVCWSNVGNPGYGLSVRSFSRCGSDVIPFVDRTKGEAGFQRGVGEAICKLRACLAARTKIGLEGKKAGDIFYLYGIRLGRQREDFTGRCEPKDRVNLGHVMMTAIMAGLHKCGGKGCSPLGYVSFASSANLGCPLMWRYASGSRDRYAASMGGLESVKLEAFPPVVSMSGDLGQLVPTAEPVRSKNERSFLFFFSLGLSSDHYSE